MAKRKQVVPFVLIAQVNQDGVVSALTEITNLSSAVMSAGALSALEQHLGNTYRVAYAKVQECTQYGTLLAPENSTESEG